MEDFNRYREKYESQNAKNGGSNKNANGLNGLGGLLNMLGKQYDGKSEEEIWAAVLAEAKRSRAAGTLTDGDLDRFAATLSPFLDGEKRKRLQSVIEALKRET